MQTYSSPAYRQPKFSPNDPALTQKLNDLSGAIDRMNAGVVPAEAEVDDPLPTTISSDIQNVEYAAVAPIATLSGTTAIDGLSLVAGDLVLLTAQANANQNGIWQVAGGTAAWQMIQSPTPQIVGVYKGNTFAQTIWILSALSPITYVMAGGSGPMQMQVVALQSDYVTAHPYASGAVVSSITLNIALPYLNRRTPFDGLTVNSIHYAYTANNARTATSGSTTETQKLTQDYYSTAIFYAERISQPVTVTIGGTATKLYWLDINSDARAWAHF